MTHESAPIPGLIVAALAHGGSAVWQPLLEGVFDRWAELTGSTYIYEPNDDGADLNSSSDGDLGVRGDIRIAGHFLDAVILLAFRLPASELQ